MTIKVKVGTSTSLKAKTSQEATTPIVTSGEKKPVIVPDSVALGVDTVGNYVQEIKAGTGVIIEPTANTEGSIVTISTNPDLEISNIIPSGDRLILTTNLVDVNGFGGFILPAGTTEQRPEPPEAGTLRYNTDDSRFEAYDGTAWTGVGGVVDVDQDTYIVPESVLGSADNRLDFYTAGVLRQRLDNDGSFRFGQNLDKVVIDYLSGNATFSGDVIEFDSSGAIIVPDGTTNQRPTPKRGMIRYNLTDSQFEGYDGLVWRGLGGVIDSDQDTYISAESFPGSDDDTLSFYTAGVKGAELSSTGEFKINQVVTDDISSDSDIISFNFSTLREVGFPTQLSDAINKDYLENTFERAISINNKNTSQSLQLLSFNPSITFSEQFVAGVDDNNNLNLSLRPTGVQSGVYGNDGFIPRIRITPDGRIDFATELSVELQANAIPDFTETTRDIMGLAFREGTSKGVQVIQRDDLNVFDVVANNFTISLQGAVSGSAEIVSLSNTVIETTLEADFISNIVSNNGIIIVGEQGPDSVFEIRHGNTSSIDSETFFTEGRVIQNLSFDEFGHVQEALPVNLDERYLRASGGVIDGEIRAKRFVDSDDTDYYIDPEGTSRISDLVVGYGATFSQIQFSDGAGSSYLYGFGGKLGFLDNTLNYAAYSEKATGNWVVKNDSIASRFVDSTSSSYYLDLDSTSNIKDLNVEDQVQVGSLSIDSTSISSSFGSITFNGNVLSNIGLPLQETDAANKRYIDELLQSALDSFVGGDGLTYTANTQTFSVNVDNSTIEIDSDVLRIKDGGVSNQKLETPYITIQTDSSNSTLYLGEDLSVAGGLSISTSISNNEILISAELASNIEKGVASFSVDSFEVSNGEVRVSKIDGDQTLSLAKRSANSEFIPSVSDLSLGELFINTADGNIYIKKSFANTESIVEFTTEPNVILERIKTVDGANSGLDADLLDGQDGTYYLDYDNFFNVPPSYVEVQLQGKVTGSGISNNALVQIQTELSNTGVQPGTYGTPSAIPVISIDEDGRIFSANTVAVAGVEQVFWYSANNTLEIQTGDGNSFYQKIDSFSNTINVDTIDVAGLVDGRDISIDGAKLDTIEFGATADQTAEEILSLLSTVDGANSSLDSDLLDGQDGTYYLDYDNFFNVPTPNDLLQDIKTVDGSGSGLDADLLDGLDSAYFTSYTDDVVANNVSDETIELIGGDGIIGGGSFTLNQFFPESFTFSHGNTSNVSDISVSNLDIIDSISFDEFGHVIAVSSNTLDLYTKAEQDLRFVNADGDTMTGDLKVIGSISQEESTFLNITASTSSTNRTPLWSFSASEYGSAELLIIANDGINRYITKMLIVHDGSEVYSTEYGSVSTSNEYLAEMEVELANNDITLFATPTSTSATNYKIYATLISF